MNKVAFHGSNQLFDSFDFSKIRITNDFYGGPVYFTENKQIAEQYASGMAKKGGFPIVYKVTLNMSKTFDVDSEFTGQKLIKFLPSNIEQFARSAGLLSLGVDKFAMLANIKSGTITLTGNQIFKGLSNGMINTSKARETLKKLGYDSLRYNGGTNMQMTIRHNVYIVYSEDQIKILDYYKP